MNILKMSISAGFLVILIVIVRAIAMNRMPKTVFVVLWGVVLGRLIIPWSIPAKYGISGIINAIIREVFLLKAESMKLDAVPGKTLLKNSAYIETVLKPSQALPFTMVWIAGIILFAAFFTISFLRWYREIRTAIPVKDKDLINKWLSEQKIKRKVRFLISDKITTPLTYGILKPRIILPKTMDFENELQLRYVLTHELIHIKRFDALWKLLMISALCLHWFNPLAWVMVILMNRDFEIACDEKVIRLYGETTRSAYALSLIRMAETKSKFTPVYSSFSKNATEERIVSIMKFKKSSLMTLVLAFVLVAGATSVFAETAVNVLRLYGVVQTNSGKYNFELDEKGIITVRNEAGKIVSTATAAPDGATVLTDENGEIITEIKLDKPQLKDPAGKLPKVLGASNGDHLLLNDELPHYKFEIDSENIVTAKNDEGRVIGSGKADANGTAVLVNDDGDEIGTVNVKDKNLIRFSLNISKN